jgi:hypothetical protein
MSKNRRSGWMMRAFGEDKYFRSYLLLAKKVDEVFPP